MKEVFTQAPLIHKLVWVVAISSGLLVYACRDQIIQFL